MLRMKGWRAISLVKEAGLSRVLQACEMTRAKAQRSHEEGAAWEHKRDMELRVQGAEEQEIRSVLARLGEFIPLEEFIF